MVSPADSYVLVDNRPTLQPDPATGRLTIGDLTPGSHVLTIRHRGYGDEQRKLDIGIGDNPPFAINLELLKGTLSVKPNVAGTSIEVRNSDQQVSVGMYAEEIDRVDFTPGTYEVIVSKPGYRPLTRSVIITASGLVELEPSLEPLPTPTPTPSFRIPTRSSVSIDGKYLIVRVTGTTGDAARTAGTVNVTANRNLGTAYVQGGLNGLPCQIGFVALENVAEGSIIDSPGPSNSWALIAVRVRAKDSKRPVSFAMNWKLIKNSSDSEANEGVASYTRAVPIHRAIPTVPAVARSSHTYGSVKVSLVIDAEGNVKSAKAFDGPTMLRPAAEDAARQWKFRPATRNGVPTESTETISFAFEGY